MLSSTTLEVPSPLAGRTSMPPAMLSSPTSNKPVGPAAAAAAPGAPVVTFSQALASAPPAQANGARKPGRPRRA